MILIATASRVGAEAARLLAPRQQRVRIAIRGSAVRAGAGHIAKITGKASPASPTARQRTDAVNRSASSGAEPEPSVTTRSLRT